VLEQLQSDLGAEQGAVKSYNDAVKLAVEVADNGSRAMLESILKDEEDHLDWLETQLDQIEQIGIQNYLAQQVS
jgi:bacterioferritin